MGVSSVLTRTTSFGFWFFNIGNEGVGAIGRSNRIVTYEIAC